MEVLVEKPAICRPKYSFDQCRVSVDMCKSCLVSDQRKISFFKHFLCVGHERERHIVRYLSTTQQSSPSFEYATPLSLLSHHCPRPCLTCERSDGAFTLITRRDSWKILSLNLQQINTRHLQQNSEQEELVKLPIFSNSFGDYLYSADWNYRKRKPILWPFEK